MKIRSLRQRLLLFLLLPVTVMLVLTGSIGFFYARNLMLERWSESARLSLSRAAHLVDMRIRQPLELIEFLETSSSPEASAPDLNWTLDKLRTLPGVVRVEADPPQDSGPVGGRRGRGMSASGSMSGGMRYHRIRITKVGAPRFDSQAGGKSVGLVLTLEDESEQPKGRLEVVVRFDYLIRDMVELEWWRNDEAYLVDLEGRILAAAKGTPQDRKILGENHDALEAELVKALAGESVGTRLGPGHPPRRVGGFRRLVQAPWAIVLFSPGEEVLGSIISFRDYYALGGGVCLVLIILLIWRVTGRMAQDIGQVAQAATRLTEGRYSSLLPGGRNDEIGRLMVSFNEMVTGLMERDRIRNTFGRYVDPEVARRLLAQPESSALGGHEARVAILMSDVRGFTELCERLEPEETIRVVNAYLSGLIETIQAEQGVIVDFLGDAILAFFEPLEGEPEEAVRRAIRCGLAMEERTKTFNSSQKGAGRPELETGIGIHFGRVVVGNIGSRARTKYGIVGAAVNFTQRLQAQAEGGRIVVSDAVRNVLGRELVVSRTFSAGLKGVAGPQTLHEIKGLVEA